MSRAAGPWCCRSTRDRSSGGTTPSMQPASSLRAARQRLLHWRQDLGRTMDYLDARGDIKMDRVAFYGRSFGASMPLPLLAIESRFRTAIFYSGGFTYRTMTPPEMDAAQLRLAREDSAADALRPPRLRLPVRHCRSARCSSCSARRPPRNVTSCSMPAHDPLPRSQVIREILAWLEKLHRGRCRSSGPGRTPRTALRRSSRNHSGESKRLLTRERDGVRQRQRVAFRASMANRASPIAVLTSSMKRSRTMRRFGGSAAPTGRVAAGPEFARFISPRSDVRTFSSASSPQVSSSRSR